MKKSLVWMLIASLILGGTFGSTGVYAEDSSGESDTVLEETIEVDSSDIIDDETDDTEDETNNDGSTDGADDATVNDTDVDDATVDDTAKNNNTVNEVTTDTSKTKAVENETAEEENVEEELNVGVQYRTHSAKIGWQSAVKDGALAGTTGRSLAVQAIEISLTNLPTEYKSNSGIKYSMHVQTYGWMSAVSNGKMAGTVGQSKRAEAIKIELTGAIAEKYDVYYRVHSQTFGWLDWASNGEAAGTAGYSKRIEAIQICLVKKGEAAPGKTTCPYKYPRIQYQAHVQTYGWQSTVSENAIAGTTGKGKRVEAIKIQLPQTKYSGGIKYRVYLQTYGWQSWKANGQVAGTSGESKRIEAIQIQLTGEMAEHYDVYYSVHLAKIGWVNYACNGEIAGSMGLSKKIEAIKIQLVEKNVDKAPATSGVKFIQGYGTSDFTYSATIKGSGSTGKIAQGGTVGTTGKSKSLQNITLYLNKASDAVPSGSIQYSTHISSVGWTGWSTQGNVSGNTDGTLGLEAVKIKLSGDISKYYDIYYRAYVQSYGWLGWAKNGQAAGTTKCGYRLEALQIRLVSKDASAPGANSNYYTENKKNVGFDAAMTAKANMYSSATPYIIMVNRGTRKVGIYQGWQGAWNSVKYWSCTVGAPSTPTITGVFTIGSRGYYFNSTDTIRAYWWTQFCGDYLFHSVLYNCYTGGYFDSRLGMALSHGCVRLAIENAKWIHDNIPAGTRVVVYN